MSNNLLYTDNDIALLDENVERLKEDASRVNDLLLKDPMEIRRKIFDVVINFIVEKNRKVSKILLHNLDSICLGDSFQVFHQDVNIFFANNNDLYDIVFADPPYGLYEFNALKYKVCKLLRYGGIFCMEQRIDKTTNFDGVKVKQYGNTQVLIWEKKKK